MNYIILYILNKYQTDIVALQKKCDVQVRDVVKWLPVTYFKAAMLLDMNLDVALRKEGDFATLSLCLLL